jgi:hypothetical protein
MGTAWAGDNNKTDLRQNGENNTGLITQDGNGNRAGTSTWAPNSYNLRQDGNDNILAIDQNGDNNAVAQANTYAHNGVKQVGSRNELNITQTRNAIYKGNVVGTVKQNADINATARTNSATIVQNGSGRSASGQHNVGLFTQTNTSTGASAANANTIVINQEGGGYQLGNQVGADSSYLIQNRVTQTGTANAVDIDQDGGRNK